MFTAIRRVAASRASVRVRALIFFLYYISLTRFLQAFSSTSMRSSDLAKLILIGRLGKEPELRYTKNEKEYVSLVFIYPLNPASLRATDIR